MAEAPGRGSGTGVRARSVLISGTSSGFGRGMTAAFLEAGWQVAATLRDPRRAGFDEESRRHPGRLRVVRLDVTSSGERRAAADFCRRTFGGLDCLVNNAGYGLLGALEDMSEDELRAQMETNFFGAAFLTRDLLPLLRGSRGRVINISSVLGTVGFPLTSAYCASKFALEGLSEALYHELRPHGVQVCLVEPGRFRTRFGENARWGAACFRHDSPYRAHTENYRRYKDSMAEGPGVAPEPVIEAVVSLASRRRMPLRVRFGSDARAAHWIKRLLPERAAAGLASRVYDRIFRNPSFGPRTP